MNRFGFKLFVSMCVICIFFSTKGLVGQGRNDISSSPKDALISEASHTKTSLEKMLADTRKQISQMETWKAAFEKNFNDVLNLIHVFRFNLRQKIAYLQQIQEQMTGFNTGDTLTYSITYWEEFTEQLKTEFNSDEWNVPDETGEDFRKINNGLDKLIETLNLKALRHPLVKDVVTNLIDFVLKKPLDPTMMVEASNGVAQLREALSGTSWEPRIFNTVKGSILSIRNVLTKIERPLETIEVSMIELNEKIAIVSRLLDHRLAKLDMLVGSIQVIARNLRSLTVFDPTEVRQQLIFLRNQNQFLDYEHRVLKSYNGEIEKAIKTKNWITILRAISRQDPDFGELNLEKNAFVLFVGANEVNRHFLLHEENAIPSNYLYAIKSLSTIWLEDNPWETYEIDMSIEVLQSEFEITFGQFKTIMEARKRGDEIQPEPTLFFYGMKKISDISSPAKINLAMRRKLLQESDESTIVTEVEEINDVFKTSYKIHERSLAHVSVGLGAGFVKKSNFILDGTQLKVSKSGDKELDQNLYALVNFHLGARDIDRFNRYPFLSFRKLMLQGGLSVSKNPLNRLYLGLGYRVLKDVQLDVLYYWRRVPDSSQSVSLDGPASLNDAKKSFEKVYQAGNFAIGLSFYPQRLYGLLGL